MIRGISFEIPNEYGRYLEDILKPFKVEDHNWWIGGEESYIILDGKLDALFSGLIECMDGVTLRNVIKNNDYYLIFQDLKAFPKGSKPIEIITYDDFLSSNCELALLVVDSSYTTIYCKNAKLVEGLYSNAKKEAYANINYITDENDFRTSLSVW
ncbi:DUF2691 family protein [Paenibacillus sp. FSL M8-0334]|uniref:DUF2691 family protein n=1 Tax=Paenibacillus sp. FSL M8-0334 TaxID=2921623 RepID=UPI0030F92600